MDKIPFSFDGTQVKPLDEEAPKVQPPAQTADGDEYLCGNSCPEHPYANAGRDQDRSRSDEYVPAQGCSRYVS